MFLQEHGQSYTIRMRTNIMLAMKHLSVLRHTVMRLVGRLSNSLWTWKNCIIIRDSYKRINIVEKQF